MTDLIRTMSQMNVLWGAPRIHSELQKLGIHISEATVAKYMVRHPKTPSQTWRTSDESGFPISFGRFLYRADHLVRSSVCVRRACA